MTSATGSDFDRLQPDLILHAIEQAGFMPTGEYAQLNSYENRVFDIRLEHSSRSISDVDRLIAKFYRPRRWTPEAIQDEHDFLNDLEVEGIPAVAPMDLRNGKTLLTIDGYTMALFPRVLGRMPQEFLNDELSQVGRTLARIHNVGARRPARHRPTMSASYFGWNLLPGLQRHVYPELWNRYEDAAAHILNYLDDELDPRHFIRIHGDCHKGNLLHTGNEFFFVDFDDCINGPTVQDFWMLLSGRLNDDNDDEAAIEQEKICLGYEELRDIPDDWHLFEPLRALRIISYASWIGVRWNDPFFKQVFPQYESYAYWSEELNVLEQIALRL